MRMPREHGQQGLVSVLGGLVYAQTAAAAEISSCVRPSPYASAENEEKEGEGTIVIFLPGI